MAKHMDRMTRVAADLMDSAAVEGARQGRSARQQLEHWARVGQALSHQQIAARRRVEAALNGDLDLRELRVDEDAMFDAEIAAAIRERLASTNYGQIAAERGLRPVGIDEEGRFIEPEDPAPSL